MTRYLLICVLILSLGAAAIAQDDEGEDDLGVELPITESLTYTVRSGDILDEIAATFDVDTPCLRETNELPAVAILSAGDLLEIDINCPAYSGAREVEVPREVFGTAATDAAETDDEMDEEPAQEEAVPLGEQEENTDEEMSESSEDDAMDEEEDTAEPVASPNPETTTPGEDTLYVVQRGDTLDVIGQDFDVSVESIVLVNDLSGSRLEIGQELLIPGDAPPYGEVPALDDGGNGQGGGASAEDVTYVIQRGDTLDVIAQEFNVSLVSLQVVNDIPNGRTITPGQTILIPGNAPVYGLFPALDSGDGQGGGLSVEGELYVVQPRDTLDQIGQAFDVSVVSLQLINDIRRGIDLTPGTTLIIPDDAPAYGLFPALDATEQGGGFDIAGELVIVQPRETVDGISARFDAAPSCVLEANEITQPRAVTAGTTLIIPDDCPPYDGFDIVPPQS